MNNLIYPTANVAFQAMSLLKIFKKWIKLSGTILKVSVLLYK